MNTDLNQPARVPTDSEMEDAWVATYRDASWSVDGEVDATTAATARAEFRAWLAARDAAAVQAERARITRAVNVEGGHATFDGGDFEVFALPVYRVEEIVSGGDPT